MLKLAGSIFVIFAITALLWGCTSPTGSTTALCLPMAQYGGDDQHELAAEVAALDPKKHRMVLRVLGDAKAMRDDDRTCLAAQGSK